MSQPSLNLHGAVDLSALARPPQPAGGAPTASGAGAGADVPVVADVTEATFQQTVELSMQVPVVVEVYASYAQGPSATLAKVATDYGGRFHLARVDVEASPQIAQAFQVQAVPTVVAIVRGQPIPLYQGDHPEEQVRQVVDEVLRVAAQAGVTGTVSGVAPDEAADAEPAEPPLPPLHAEALEAIEREDYAAAADAYRRALKENPADHEATAALAQVELIMRTAAAGGLEAVAAAQDAPATDVTAHLAAADAEIAAGQYQAAFDRVLAVVRATAGEDREEARKRLVEYFEIVGNADPAVADARRALASALY